MSTNNVSKVTTQSGNSYHLRDLVLRAIDGIDTAESSLDYPSDSHIVSTKAIVDHVNDKIDTLDGEIKSWASGEFGSAKNIVDGSNSGSLRGVSSQEEGSNYIIGRNATSLGQGTIAKRQSQLVIGEYNEPDSSGTSSTRGSYVFIVGGGSDENSRSTVFTINWNGDVEGGSINGYSLGPASEKSVDDSISSETVSLNVPTSQAVVDYVGGEVENVTSYVDDSIESAIGGISGIDYQVVQELPQTGSKGIIYLVPNNGSHPNIYDEYIYYNDRFEKIGTTEIDLSGYIQGSGTTGYLAKFNSNGSITDGPSLGSSTDHFLRNDGTWAEVDVEDTKNTAGALDTNDKIFIVGATSQSDHPQTYTHDSAYVGIDGKLYSGGSVVLVGGTNASSSVTIVPQTENIYKVESQGYVLSGEPNVPTQIDTSKFIQGSFLSGVFTPGTLPQLDISVDSEDEEQLNIDFSPGTLPSHASDSYTSAAIGSGFYKPGTANVPTQVYLPQVSEDMIAVWTGYDSATADAQVFTGSSD